MTRFDDPVPILLAHELFTNTHIVHELSRIGKVSSKRAVQASSVISAAVVGGCIKIKSSVTTTTLVYVYIWVKKSK